MKRTAILLLITSIFLNIFLSSCGANQLSSGNNSIDHKDQNPDQKGKDPDIEGNYGLDTKTLVAMQAIDKHCRACHGLGEIRFIYSDNPKANWEYIKSSNIRPETSWLQAIYDSINWDSDFPSFGSQRLPGKEWMPIGAKRLHLYNDKTKDGESVRQIILETFLDELNK